MIESNYMNYKQAMKYLGIGSYQTLYYFMAHGLKVITIGGIRKISKRECDEFMEANLREVKSYERGSYYGEYSKGD